MSNVFVHTKAIEKVLKWTVWCYMPGTVILLYAIFYPLGLPMVGNGGLIVAFIEILGIKSVFSQELPKSLRNTLVCGAILELALYVLVTAVYIQSFLLLNHLCDSLFKIQPSQLLPFVAEWCSGLLLGSLIGLGLVWFIKKKAKQARIKDAQMD